MHDNIFCNIDYFDVLNPDLLKTNNVIINFIFTNVVLYISLCYSWEIGKTRNFVERPKSRVFSHNFKFSQGPLVLQIQVNLEIYLYRLMISVIGVCFLNTCLIRLILFDFCPKGVLDKIRVSYLYSPSPLWHDVTFGAYSPFKRTRRTPSTVHC